MTDSLPPPKCEWSDPEMEGEEEEAHHQELHAILAAQDAQIAELRALVDDILRDNYDDKEWTRRAEAVLARKEQP